MIADSSKPNKLRNVYTIRSTTRNVTIQERTIYYIKIKVIAFIINFRRNKSIPVQNELRKVEDFGECRRFPGEIMPFGVSPVNYSDSDSGRLFHVAKRRYTVSGSSNPRDISRTVETPQNTPNQHKPLQKTGTPNLILNTPKLPETL